jgi:hypothetical protein
MGPLRISLIGLARGPRERASQVYAVGMLAHAVRWFALSVVGFGTAGGAPVACLVVGLTRLACVRSRQDSTMSSKAGEGIFTN